MKQEELIETFIPEPLRPFMREPLFDVDEIAAYALTNAFAIPALLEQRTQYWTRRAASDVALPVMPGFTPPKSSTVIPLDVYEACARQHWRPR